MYAGQDVCVCVCVWHHLSTSKWARETRELCSITTIYHKKGLQGDPDKPSSIRGLNTNMFITPMS